MIPFPRPVICRRRHVCMAMQALRSPQEYGERGWGGDAKVVSVEPSVHDEAHRRAGAPFGVACGAAGTDGPRRVNRFTRSSSVTSRSTIVLASAAMLPRCSTRLAKCVAWVAVGAEMRNEQCLGPPITVDQRHARLPGVDVDVRWRRGRHDEQVGTGAITGRVPTNATPLDRSKKADMMRGVPRSIGDVDTPGRPSKIRSPPVSSSQVVPRHRQKLAPQPVHIVAIEPTRAAQQLGRVPPCAAPPVSLHMHLDLGVLAHERTRWHQRGQGGCGVRRIGPHVTAIGDAVLSEHPRAACRDRSRDRGRRAPHPAGL